MRKITSLTARYTIPVVSDLFLTNFLEIFYQRNENEEQKSEKNTFFRTKNTKYVKKWKKYAKNIQKICTFSKKICTIPPMYAKLSGAHFKGNFLKRMRAGKYED